MRWLPSISFLSSSTASSSSSSSSSAFRSTSCGIVRSDSRQKKPAADGNLRGGSFGSRRKLTRQRKLRHLTGQNVSGPARWSDSHSLDSPEGLRRWSTSRDHLQNGSSSASAVPQPLPLPELSSFFRRKENSGEGDCRLPSPKPGPSRGVEDRDRDRADGIGEGVSTDTRIRR